MEFKIKRPDLSIEEAVIDKINNLTKPKGSLGRLEELAKELCIIQHSTTPILTKPTHILFSADHGIERERVSLSPREITWQQTANFLKGRAGINFLCRQHNFDLIIVDSGVDFDFPENRRLTPEAISEDSSYFPNTFADDPSTGSFCSPTTSRICGIVDLKMRKGTDNFLYGPAMTLAEMEECFRRGALVVEKVYGRGCNVVSFGEMGIANTSPSSIWMSLFGNIPLEECIGAGSGVAGEGLRHKVEVLLRSVENMKSTSGIKPAEGREYAEEVIRWFGGFEMCMTIGGMLRAAELGMVILVDGFIMTNCILAASRLHPEVLDYAIFGHCGDENGHRRALGLMNARPLVSLGFRLGEGTGAICAYPIIESAVRMLNEMDSFKGASITKYF